MHRGAIARMSRCKVVDSGTRVLSRRSDHCSAFQSCLPPEARRVARGAVGCRRSILLSHVHSLDQKAWK